MRQISTYSFSWIIIIALAVIVSYGFAAAPQTYTKDSLSYSFIKKPKKKGPLAFSLPPIKPGVTSTIKVNVARVDDKLLSGVEVYPNPITDQINLKYSLSRSSAVNIRMMDILGNKVIALFSQRVEPGEQTFSYVLNSKLNKGFYFIRIDAGAEFVIKRVSIL